MIPIPIVTGATASGKSRLVYEVAERFKNIEIISADAFQVYKGIDIGTAKPSLTIQEKYPHHLIDIVPVEGIYTAGDFVEHAEAAIADILNRKKIPIIVGGTGLYISSLINGIYAAPAGDDILRKELKERAERDGNESLHNELMGIDPKAASMIQINDLVRVIRALEIWYKTGMTRSEAQKVLHKMPKYKYNTFVIDYQRDELYSNINKRVLEMIAQGWIEEAKALMQQGYSPDLPSLRAIGYRELFQFLSGDMTEAKAVELISQKTRNYAKRQLTWFRGMGNVTFARYENVFQDLNKLVSEWS